MTGALRQFGARRGYLAGLIGVGVVASPLGAQQRTFDQFRAAFATSAAAAIGDAAMKRWDSTAVFVRRSWALHALGDGIRLSAPTMSGSLRNASLPANQLKPVDLDLQMQLVPVKVCDGSGCGFLSFACDAVCDVLDVVASAAATALNGFLVIANGKKIGTFTPENVRLNGNITARAAVIDVDTLTGHVHAEADVVPHLTVSGHFTIDIRGPAEFLLACSGISADIDHEVKAQSTNAASDADLEAKDDGAGNVVFTLVPNSSSISVFHIDLPSVFSLYWGDPANFFKCPNPLVGVLFPVADWLKGGLFHPDANWSTPAGTPIVLGSLQPMPLQEFKLTSVPIIDPSAVGVVIK